MPPKTLLIGISGPSSSGKTTLSRLLRDIYPNTFILHEDDFYKTDAEIPVNAEGLQDWDCLEAIDLAAFESALTHVKQHGTSPPGFASKEDQNAVGVVDVRSGTVEQLKEAAGSVSGVGETRIAIIDGFLLFSEAMASVRGLFDVKVFLRTDFQTTKTRREARKGYVTLEGFWEDPPGYVDKVVWPNYVEDHAFMFEDGDVEGVVRGDLVKSLGISVMPWELRQDLEGGLRWIVGVLQPALESMSGG
ncbi:hypothetical protein MBLNU230_g8485t1 [Neophaeotheca triangularis]